MTNLITGCAGFIGFHLSLQLLKKNKKIIGIDNLNNYYDQKLKRDRLKILKSYKHFFFYKESIQSKKIKKIFSKYKIDNVINLAAQAGVRYSISNPDIYLKSNLIGFCNLIELSKEFNVKHFIYASTSSVYGENKKNKFSEKDTIEKPLQFYAATKSANELIAYSYSNIFKLRTTGLRFFTVYGPWGRPDMSLFKFVKNGLMNKKVEIYNHGKHLRDFTYVDDIVFYVNKILQSKLDEEKRIPHDVYNIGGGSPIKLMSFVKIIEKKLKITLKKKYLNLQKGDIVRTNANNHKLIKKFKIKKFTKIERGVSNFISWYKKYYKIKNV
jgi:UDP-glucuronate 4-epimerase|tara:strand:+ start:326 stop:1303 length:978 start_codon:yes stop_codon:yes gene_type:complete